MYPETQKKIAEMLKDAVFPGATYTFIDKDKTETRLIGSAAILPEREALREGMLYDVASLTKVIVTTTLLLQLHEEGEINFEDPVRAYLPAFPSAAVTIRHLLTHTSDLKGYIKNRDALSAEELTAALISLEPGENLGKKVVYTDTGLILAGFIIEKLTGKSVEENFEERIKQPLAMTEQHLSTDRSDALRSDAKPSDQRGDPRYCARSQSACPGRTLRERRVVCADAGSDPILPNAAAFRGMGRPADFAERECPSLAAGLGKRSGPAALFGMEPVSGWGRLCVVAYRLHRHIHDTGSEPAKSISAAFEPGPSRRPQAGMDSGPR